MDPAGLNVDFAKIRMLQILACFLCNDNIYFMELFPVV